MVTNPDYPYPECLAELTVYAKQLKAKEIFKRLLEFTSCQPYPRFFEDCQADFKLASLVGYQVAAHFFKEHRPYEPFAMELRQIDPMLLPVRYCGGNMCFGRVFSINHAAFSSSDSIVGFRNGDNATPVPQEYLRVLKGLKYFGTYKNWTLFKLDRDSTDDMTGALYTPLEKNFTVQFAHFPHDAERRLIYSWEDC